MDAETLAAALSGRRNGKGWRARCPAHNDRDPSLDIDIGDDGRVLLCCRAGCENTAIIDILRGRGLWETERDWTSGHRPTTKSNHSEKVRRVQQYPSHPQLGDPSQRFEYFNAAGDLIGAICRWNKPDGTKEIRPVTLRDNGFAWAGFPKPHALYRLGDVAARPNVPVLVVEGEKAADAARELVGDVVVVTWAHGAQAIAHADWTPLTGRDVILWPDADEPGQKAMREIGAALRTINARTVRLVKLPDDLPKGWDLADEIPSDLDPVALIAEARDIAVERVAALKLISAATLAAQEFKPPKWAIPDLVPEGLTLIAGKPKTGKSWMALDFALSVAGGGYALGNVACEPGEVLYLALEDTPRRLNGRIRAVLQGAPAPAGLDIATEWRRADEGGLEDLRAWLSTHRRARLVVVDTLQKMRGTRKRDAGVYEDDYRVVADFKKLADEFTVPIILVHHLNKEGNSDPLMAVSGTAGITGSADTILVLAREPNDPNGLLYVRGRDVTEAEIAIRFDGDTGKWLKLGKGADWRLSEERRSIIRAVTAAGPTTPKEIAELVGKKPGSTRMLLAKMVKTGEITQMADGKYTV